MVFALIIMFFAGVAVGAVVMGLLGNADDGDEYLDKNRYSGTCADCVYFNKAKHACMNSYNEWDLY